VFKQKQTNKKLKQTKKKQNKRQSIQTKTNEQKSLQQQKTNNQTKEEAKDERWRSRKTIKLFGFPILRFCACP
jgi:hypothetical protein